MISPPPSFESVRSGVQRRIFVSIALVFALLLAAVSLLHHQQWRRQQWSRLLTADSARLAQDRKLTAFAVSEAQPLYIAHCSGCHAVDMRGDRGKGAPNLADPTWLFGDGSVFEIERTILYGVRSEHGKSRNVTDMPAFGLTGRLSAAEIRNLVQYLLQLSGRPHDVQAAIEGRSVYFDVAKANCADCHGDTAQGNSNYGAPDLTIDAWLDGNDSRVFFDAIYSGQHRIMPGWIGTLPLAQIRALAIYVYAASHARSAHEASND
jgi:cytochrome c oxidase cbb3-type subunit III